MIPKINSSVTKIKDFLLGCVNGDMYTKFFDERLLAREIRGEIFFTGGDDEFGFFGYSDEFELQVDELLLLRTDLFLEFLGVFEETLGCWDDRILFDFPELSELSDDVGFAVE